jgi:hypothetical protein
VLPRLPQALAPLPPPRLSVRGRRLPPLRGGRPPSLSSSSSSPDDKYTEVAGGEGPCCSHSRNSSSLCSQRSRRQILRSLRAARSCSRHCAARARLGLGRGRDRPHGVRGHPLLGRVKCQSHAGVSRMNKGKGGEPTHRQGVGKHNERPEVVVAMPDGLEADGAPRPRGRILQGERSCTNRERASDTGLAVSLIS